MVSKIQKKIMSYIGQQQLGTSLEILEYVFNDKMQKTITESETPHIMMYILTILYTQIFILVKWAKYQYVINAKIKGIN